MSKKEEKTYFQLNWLSDAEFQDWISKGIDDTHFGCKFCKVQNLSLGNMGKKAVRLHSTAKNMKIIGICGMKCTISSKSMVRKQ